MREQNAARFDLLKIKVNATEGLDLLREVTRLLPGHALLVDGNETWPDADGVLQFLERARALPGLNLRLLEQPMPAACVDDYRHLRPRVSVPLIADESVTDTADFRNVEARLPDNADGRELRYRPDLEQKSASENHGAADGKPLVQPHRTGKRNIVRSDLRIKKLCLSAECGRIL